MNIFILYSIHVKRVDIFCLCFLFTNVTSLSCCLLLVVLVKMPLLVTNYCHVMVSAIMQKSIKESCCCCLRIANIYVERQLL